jgi:hypothetical protein
MNVFQNSNNWGASTSDTHNSIDLGIFATIADKLNIIIYYIII